jgi:hypothetical protein
MPSKNQKLRAQYREMKKQDHPMQICKACGERSPKNDMEPHHPSGRAGVKILDYFWLHSPCHAWVHLNQKEAEKKGLLIKGRNIT